ncbi:DUF4231 domain-containing protein [Micromonospora sp. URMC 103]|uniref:DUF4231 domain-containing protein n=1 Tax=Micromonospora sp. URMC 103 TaxID=3423406 RepID=UPI003F1CF9EE
MAAQFDVNLQPTELASRLVTQIRDGIEYTRSRTRTFSRNASLIRLTTLALSASSAVILGLQDLNVWASVAFSMVALTTLAGAVESFFNWRSRWVLMEEMKGRLHRLEDDLRYHLAKAGPDELRSDDLDEYFARLQEIWADSSRQWTEARRTGQHP